MLVLNTFKYQRQGGFVVRLDALTVIRAPVERCFDLARGVEVHLAGNVHWGEAAMAMGGVTSGLARHGTAGYLPCEALWRPAEPRQRNHGPGPAGLFSGHDDSRRLPAHETRSLFSRLSREETGMKDVFCFSAPLPGLGRLAEIAFLRRYMRALLRERHMVLKEVAESSQWQRYLP